MREFSWRMILRTFALSLLAIAMVFWLLTIVAWFVTEPSYEPLNVFVSAVVSSLLSLLSFIRSFTVREGPSRAALATASLSPGLRLRSRGIMLERVKAFWVKGVLEQSLHGAALIELDLEERGDAVKHPWDIMLRERDQPNRPLPPGTSIVDLFDEMNQALLILGSPGSGKTTMLLEFTREMIFHAERDPALHIPVVFNLSSWSERRHCVSDWLVEELNAKYSIPRAIARHWIERQDLLLLLDGLDEVNLEAREACVKALNNFRKDFGLTPLVVCSRTRDYEVLSTQLNLYGAVLLQPLTVQQIDEHLESLGDELALVRRAIQRDAALRELAHSPLMLSVMTLAYEGMSLEQLQALNTAEAQRKHLFDTYVHRMFGRRGTEKPFSTERAMCWLAWLARYMSQRPQSVFLMEHLQPTWLVTSARRWLHVIIVVAITGFLGGMIRGLAVKSSGGLASPLIGASAEVFFAVALGGLIGILIGRPSSISEQRDFIEPAEVLKWSWGKAIGTLGQILRTATDQPFADSSLEMHEYAYMVRISDGKIERSVDSLGVRVHYRHYGDRSEGFDDMFSVVILGLFLLLISGSAGMLVGVLLFGPGIGLVSGLIFWPTLLLAGALILMVRRADIEVRTAPNQGIRQSARNAVAVWLMMGLICGLIGWVVWGLAGEQIIGLTALLSAGSLGLPSAKPIWGLIGGSLWGLVLGLFVGLEFGGRATIQHYALRFVLCRKGCIPWRYARFLDYATNQIILRKVGGGYMFIHRLLQDHFASL